MMGQWERGISLIGEAIARNPAHPGWYHTRRRLTSIDRAGMLRRSRRPGRSTRRAGSQPHHSSHDLWPTRTRRGGAGGGPADPEFDPDFEENAWYELQLRNLPEQVAEQ